MKHLFKHFIIIYLLVGFTTQVSGQTENIKLNLSSGYPSLSLKTSIETNVSKLLSEINTAYLTHNEINFDKITLSESAAEGINALLSSDMFYCTQPKLTGSLLKTPSGYEIRKIPIRWNNQNDDDEIVIVLNAKGAVEDVYLAVGEHQYANISIGNNVVDETRKNIIRNFLEAMRTAYVTKNLSFIDDVFSEKALIIVGRKIQRSTQNSFQMTDTPKQSLYSSSSDAQYTKLTKTQYLNNLKQVFRNNKKIEIDFSNIQISQHEKEKFKKSFYGVRLIQDWKGDNYRDKGLLFFLIQFKENENPVIWVRVWQDAETTGIQQIDFGDIKIRE